MHHFFIFAFIFISLYLSKIIIEKICNKRINKRNVENQVPDKRNIEHKDQLSEILDGDMSTWRTLLEEYQEGAGTKDTIVLNENDIYKKDIEDKIYNEIYGILTRYSDINKIDYRQSMCICKLSEIHSTEDDDLSDKVLGCINNVKESFRIYNIEFKPSLINVVNRIISCVRYNYLVPDILSRILLIINEQYKIDIYENINLYNKSVLLNRALLISLYFKRSLNIYDKNKLEFNFQKNERLFYYCSKVDIYLEKRISRTMHTSSGMSFRIVRGLYYGRSAGQSERISYDTIEKVGEVNLAVTSKYLYYGGRRVQLNKIVSVIPYIDGVVVNIDRIRDSKLYFYVQDPEFFAILLKNANYFD